MKKVSLFWLLSICFSCAFFVGCGQTGPLYLPKPAVAAPTTPAQVPAEPSSASAVSASSSSAAH